MTVILMFIVELPLVLRRYYGHLAGTNFYLTRCFYMIITMFIFCRPSSVFNR